MSMVSNTDRLTAYLIATFSGVLATLGAIGCGGTVATSDERSGY
jgi:hypothetical protein